MTWHNTKEIGWHTIKEIEWHSIQEIGWHKMEEIRQHVSLLQACHVFKDATRAALEFTAAECEFLSFKKDATVILENEANSSVYFIVRGQVEIATYLTDEKRIKRTSLLNEGDHFGEFSILTQSARSGSAYAYSDCELFKISGARFMALLETHPDVTINLLVHLARITNTFLHAEDFIPYFRESSAAPAAAITQLFPPSMWKKFGAIPVSLKAGVLSFAVQRASNPSLVENIRRQFPKIEINFSIVEAHKFEQLFESASATLRPAAAPSVVKTPLPPIDIRASLRQADLFARAAPELIDQIVADPTRVRVAAGELILGLDQTTEAIFIVLSGNVLLSRKIRGESAQAPLLNLNSGQTIGECQILLEEGAPCTYRAIEDTELLVISKDTINGLLDQPNFALDFLRTLAKRLQAFGHLPGLTFVPQSAEFNFEKVAKLLAQAQIKEDQVLPLKIENGEITIGMVHPESSKTLIKLGRYLPDDRLRLVCLTEQQFQTYFKLYMETAAVREAPVVSMTNESDLLKWLDSVLTAGLRSSASDIHFEPGPDGLTTRFRVDGVLREYGKKIPTASVSQIVNRIKILSKMDIAVQYLPQDGHLEVNSAQLKLQARVSTLPVKHGEAVVLRLIRERNSVVPLEVIAPDQRIVQFFKTIASRRQGLFLVTGPTGSGKTTTLYSLLKALNQVDVKLISIEDPIEMEISGISQVEINAKRGVEFLQTLRSVLRQDVDVLMVGEIRDAQSAKMVFDAATTGHLVLSTIHAGTSFDTIARLKDLGVTSAQIAETLLGVATQRLVRTVCKSCAKAHPLTENERALFERFPDFEIPEVIKRGEGCDACGQTGYAGRIPAFEVWTKSRALSDGIRNSLPNADLETLAREQGFEYLYESGLRLVQCGLTTPEEVSRVLQDQT
jgi:type II secretory ATPase GspE/PulE/Tfp pilus assembly ATPase PilB-like protein